MLLRVTVCLSHGLDGGVSILYRCLMCVPHMCLMCVPHLCALHVALPVCLTCVSLICLPCTWSRRGHTASYIELLPHTLRHGSAPATPVGLREGGRGGGSRGGEIAEGKLLIATGLTQRKLLRMVLDHMLNLTLNLKLRLWSLVSSPFVWYRPSQKSTFSKALYREALLGLY